MYMVVFVMIPRLLLSPLLLRISDGLGIGYDRGSSFFLSGSIGFVTGLLTSGFVSKALTHRRTIVLSVTGAGLAMLALSQVRTELAFHLVFIVLSWTNGLYPGSGIASVTALVPDAHHGKAFALHESGPNLAFILAPLLSALLAPRIGWRGVLMVIGITATVSGLVFAAAGRGSTRAGEPPHFENIKLFARNRTFWIMSVFFMLAVSIANGVFSILPTYLIVEHGYPETLVNTLVGASRISAFAAIFVAGGLADHFGIKKVLGVIFALTGAVTVALGVARGPLLLLCVFLQPIVIGSFFPVGLSALTASTPEAARNLSVALAIPPANVVGSGLAPPALAALGSAGHFGVGFVGLGVVAIASLALLPLITPRLPPSPGRKAAAV